MIYQETQVKDRTLKVIQTLQDLKQDLFGLTGLPRTLSDLGIATDLDINSEIAKNTINDGSVASIPNLLN